jgi:phosphohistidine phosphatase
MKKIIIVRHAKSSWEFDVIDHERPLNSRGKSDAILVSKSIATIKLNFDLVLCSDAIRTKSTLNIFKQNLEIKSDIVIFNHDLYDFSGENLLRVIKSVDSSVNSFMLFGHNHAITNFVNTYGDTFIDNVPTCGVVVIEFDIEDWQDLKPGKTTKTLFPRDLK